MRQLSKNDSDRLRALATQYGTPAYAYDAEIIRRQYQRLESAFSASNAKIRFAMKALSNPAVLSLLADLGSGVDAVSIGEVRLALHAGIPSSDISFTPSLPPIEVVQQAIDLGVHVTVDSLSLLEKFGRTFGSEVPCSLRINPHIKAGANKKVQTGHKKSKFGISVDFVERAADLVSNYGIKVVGLHVHTGSDVADAEIFVRSAEVLFAAAELFEDVEIFDLGGGFKVAYRFGENDADVELIGAKCAQIREQYIQRSGRRAEIWLEPGKYLVSASGCLLAEATTVKKSPAVTFVGVDTGLNHLIRPMFYDAYHEIENISNPSGVPQKYTVVGNICETDTFAKDRMLPEVREGDLLVFRSAGAYGFTMASQFNSHPRPPEILVDAEESRLIRRRETFEDLLTAYA